MVSLVYSGLPDEPTGKNLEASVVFIRFCRCCKDIKKSYVSAEAPGKFWQLKGFYKKNNENYSPN